MSYMLQIVTNVIKRRIASGEIFEDILKNYPKLKPEEIILIKSELSIE